jgi:hypothetical protein
VTPLAATRWDSALGHCGKGVPSKASPLGAAHVAYGMGQSGYRSMNRKNMQSLGIETVC